MQRNRLGCLTGTGILAALITALFIVGYAFASGGQMFSPGPLHAIPGESMGGVTSHAQIAGACSACHAAPWEPQTMDDRCVVCHTDVPVQMQDTQTPHGRMFAVDSTAACRDCHPEHRGPEAGLTEIEGWRYPHELSGYSLAAHQFKAENDPFKCADCHGADVTTFNVNDCAACHRQKDQAFTEKHITSFGGACLDCHDGYDRFDDMFTHDRYPFKLVGKHAPVACESCHAASHNLADLATTPRDCAACHRKDDRHGGTLGTDCASCHTPDGWKPAHFDHNLSVFKLTGSHVNVACQKCHLDNTFKGTPKDCFSCHKPDDQHGGLLGQDCGSCHTPTNWKEVTFDHSRSAFPLLGKHTSVACADCHRDNAFKGTPKDCASCHSDIHKGQMNPDCASCHNPGNWKDVRFDHSTTRFPLIDSHEPVACAACHVNGVYRGTAANCFACHASDDAHKGQFGTDCGSCHNPSAWKNVSFNHNRTSFPLTGRHVNLSCTACHINGIFKGTAQNCYACHAAEDPHGGQFGTDCATCHNPSNWKNVSFDHNNTAFALTGAHTGVPCQTCHVNGVFKGTPKECVACHAAKDAHNGQFGTVCSTCHSTNSWQGATFNHGNTAFPLAGSHASVACASCHANNVYKGTPKDCYACHAARDAHNGQFGTNCGSCHVPTKWTDVTFNHSNTVFPLTGLHTNVQCGACHSSGVYKGTPTNCYACHAAKDAHNGQFGADCGSCHNPSGWGNATFDHNNTAFPLVGHHAQLQCSNCHSNGVYRGTPTQCIACHADKDEHNGANGTDCAACHTPTDWGNVK